MTMFEELYALATTATLTMSLSADVASGRLTINVVPRPRKDADEPALTQALSLTATPQEFDAGFVQALRGFRVVRQSLEQQAQATRDLLAAAQAASARKAGDAKARASGARPSALARTTVPAAAALARPVEDEEDALGDEPVAPVQPEVAGTPSTALGGPSFDLFG